ncbi:hypothetical protein HDU67_010017 [Dinochytrium kinnereticum]|nr:hypothetical protein HDU67_010017 [Dinochytrium kinnereticum]
MDASEYEKLVANKASFDLLNVIVALTSTNQNLTRKLEESEGKTSSSRLSSPKPSRRAKSPAPATSARSSTDNLTAHRSREPSFVDTPTTHRGRSRSPSPTSRTQQHRRSIPNSMSARPPLQQHRDDRGVESDVSVNGARRRRPSSASSYAATTFASEARRRNSNTSKERAPHQGVQRPSITSVSPSRSYPYPVPSQRPRTSGYEVNPVTSSKTASPSTRRDVPNLRISPASHLPRQSSRVMDQSDIDDNNLESQSEFSEALSPTSNASVSWYQGGGRPGRGRHQPGSLTLSAKSPRGGGDAGRIGVGAGTFHRPASREEYGAAAGSYSRGLRASMNAGEYLPGGEEGFGNEDDPTGRLPSSKDLLTTLDQRRRSSDRPSSGVAQSRRPASVQPAASVNEGLRSYFTDEDMAGFSETTRRILFGGAGGAGGTVGGEGSGGGRGRRGAGGAVSDGEALGGRFGNGVNAGRVTTGYSSLRGSAASSPMMVQRKESLRDVIRARMKEMDFAGQS